MLANTEHSMRQAKQSEIRKLHKRPTQTPGYCWKDLARQASNQRCRKRNALDWKLHNHGIESQGTTERQEAALATKNAE